MLTVVNGMLLIGLGYLVGYPVASASVQALQRLWRNDLVALKGSCPNCGEEVFAFVRTEKSNQEPHRAECHVCESILEYRTKVEQSLSSPSKRWVYGRVGQMRRQGQYADPGMNPMVAAQIQQHMSAQRLQQLSGNSQYSGRDPMQPGEDHHYNLSKMEGQWQWHRDGSKDSSELPPYAYNEGQGTDGARSLYESQRLDSKQPSKDPRAQARHNEMEAGREDNILPQTYEGLEQKFLNDVVKLSKELHDAEDAENARHRERLGEINAQYQEKLIALRARQATRREEFLRKESQARLLQYQQASMQNYQNSAGPSEAQGFSSAAATAAAASAAGSAYAESQRDYASAGHYESYGQRSEVGRGGRGRGFEPRGQYSGGRGYNSDNRYY
uniref:Uncharacterized protein n=1 Tax=Ananas comosus var. bracteatus TaxID=296719 RepID=A0A6V7QSY3_ANACO